MAKALNDTLGVKRTIKHFDFSEPYWEETKQKKLVIQYCKATGKYQHFPRPVSLGIALGLTVERLMLAKLLDRGRRPSSCR